MAVYKSTNYSDSLCDEVLQGPTEAFDRLTRLVRELLDVPIAFLTLDDERRLRPIASIGMPCGEINWAASLGAQAIESGEVTVVEDIAEDDRFLDRFNGTPGIRFYAAAPLEMPDESRIGALCALDEKPRSLSRANKERLAELASMAARELELRRESIMRKKAERRYRHQHEILEKINNGRSLQYILSDLVKSLEQECPEMIASIMLYDEEGGCLRHGAAPSLPDEYIETVDGLLIGPRSGSCAAAIYTGDSVITEDIATDPRWATSKDVALDCGLKRCWSSPIKDAEGHPIASFAIYNKDVGSPSDSTCKLIQDVKSMARLAIERQREAEVLRVNKRRFETAFEDPHILVGLLTPEGRVIDINGTALEYIEEGLDEIKGEFFWNTPWFENQTPLERHQIRELTEQTAEGVHAEVELHLPLNEERIFWSAFRPVCNNDEEVTSLFVFGRDITKQKKAGQALRRNRDLLRRTEELARVGGWEYDLEHDALQWTAGVYRIYGVPEDYEPSVDEAIGFYHPDDRDPLRQAFETCIETGEPFEMDVRLIRNDGEIRWVHAKGEALTAEDDTSESDIVTVRGTILDFTDQKETEQELRRSRAFLRRTEEIAKVGGWEADLQTGEQRWTAGMYAIHGVPYDFNPTIENRFEFYHPEDREEVASIVKRCVETGEPFDVEQRIVRPDGETRWVQAYGEAIQDQDGEIIAFRGATNDITEQKETEHALRKSKSKLRALANSIPGVLFQFHAESEGSYSLHYISDQSRSLLSLSPDATFEDVLERIPESHQDEVAATLERIVEQAIPATIEFPFEKEPNEVLWLHAEGHPEETPTGLLFNGVLLDITEQKEAEREIRVLAAAVDQSNESILITEAKPIDPPGPRILYVNPAFEEMTGYAKDEVIGETVRLLHGPETDRAVLKRFRTCLEEGQVFSGETTTYRKDGAPFVLNWTMAPVRDESGRIEYWVAIQRDVTEERNREKDLRQAKEEAEEAARLKSALLTNVSHEIRTPLTSVLGFAEALEEMDLGDEPNEFTRLISQSGQRLLSTLNSVLDLSQLEAGMMHVTPTRVHVDEWLRDMVDGFCPQARKAGVQLNVDSSGTSAEVALCEASLQRALANLIGNALKFTPEGGKVTVRSKVSEKHILFEVEDTGVGIDPAFLPDLFTAYQQESTGPSRDYEGVGLGLAITERIVDLHGGNIDVESEKGVGSCFRIRLPRQPGTTPKAPRSLSWSERSSQPAWNDRSHSADYE